MEPEERKMLKKTLELAQENNKMLRSLKHSLFWGRVVRGIYWLIIIGAAVGIYITIDPYINEAIDTYGSIKGFLKSIGDSFRK
ncbi:MAG: hypothetical protein GX627_00420 [Parcubacteria group bacterium]|jgi:uncharacterized membrane protein|nr:hypothetical protein [Parcubacteria group bacterium]